MTPTDRRKRKREELANSRRQEKEIFKDLKEKHAEKYDTPKLRLWSRMMASNLHDSLDEPPNVPAFNGSTPKKSRQQSFSDAISGAAIAFANVLHTRQSPKGIVNESSIVMPEKSVELRMKNFEQLQQLFDDKIIIITDSEYVEQKQAILTSLRKL